MGPDSRGKSVNLVSISQNISEVAVHVSQENIARARSIRRRRVRERQAIVFGVLAAILGIIGLWAIGVYNGAIALPFDSGFSSKQKVVDPVTDVACLPAKTMPVAAGKIKVNVLNASEQGGVAAAVAKELSNRGMKIGKTGNSTSPRMVTSIVYGPGALSRAYTLAAHFQTSAIILDDTIENKTITVNIGESFSGLVATENVELEEETPMITREGCKDLWELTDKVEAPEAKDEEEDTSTTDKGTEENAPDDKATEEDAGA